MKKSTRLLIGTLYSGENEFEQCVRSLQSQTYPHWEHEVYENLPNKEAHETLYQEFMGRSDEFDLFMKLDADMVFKDSTSLARVVEIFQEKPTLDHLQMVVHDWLSDSLIMGVHVFSDRAVWDFRNENLFVDYPPSIPGERWRLWGSPAPLVVHSPNPSPFQAFRFGVHRALKAFQPSRASFNLEHAEIQWAILKGVWRHFVSSEDRRLGLAIMGAEQVIQGNAVQEHYDDIGRDLEEIYSPFAELTSRDLYDFLAPVWENSVRREVRHKGRVFPRHLRTKMIWLVKGGARKLQQMITRRDV